MAIYWLGRLRNIKQLNAPMLKLQCAHMHIKILVGEVSLLIICMRVIAKL